MIAAIVKRMFGDCDFNSHMETLIQPQKQSQPSFATTITRKDFERPGFF